MSKSYRTEKPARLAPKKLKRTQAGVTGLRIIEKKPYPGDVHPLTKKDLATLLFLIPDEYLYGLKGIELRARMSGKDGTSAVGQPFGCYLQDEKTIHLFSLPVSWAMQTLSAEFRATLESYGAEIETERWGLSVNWPYLKGLAHWFFMDVFAHELGHHYDNQYRHRHGSKRCTRIEEWLADHHALKIKKSIHAMIKQRKNQHSDP